LTLTSPWPLIFAAANGATGVSDMSGKASRVEVEHCGRAVEIQSSRGSARDGRVWAGLPLSARVVAVSWERANQWSQREAARDGP